MINGVTAILRTALLHVIRSNVKEDFAGLQKLSSEGKNGSGKTVKVKWYKLNDKGKTVKVKTVKVSTVKVR